MVWPGYIRRNNSRMWHIFRLWARLSEQNAGKAEEFVLAVECPPGI